MTHRRTASAFLVLLLACLTGCGLPHSHLVSRKEPLTDKDHGVVVVSLGSASMKTPAIDLATTQSDGKPTSFRMSTNVYNAWNATQVVRLGPGGSRRMLLAFSATPGTYAVDSVHLYIPGYPITYNGTVRLPRPYRFQIEAGKITYLGVVEVDMTTGPNVIGEVIPALSRQVPSAMNVRLLDEFEEDNRLLLNLRPELRAAPVLRPLAR